MVLGMVFFPAFDGFWVRRRGLGGQGGWAIGRVALISLTLPRANIKLTTCMAMMAVIRHCTNGQDLAVAAMNSDPNNTNMT